LEIVDSFLLGAYGKGQWQSNGDVTDDVSWFYDVLYDDVTTFTRLRVVERIRRSDNALVSYVVCLYGPRGYSSSRTCEV